MKSATTTLHQDLSKHPDIFCGKKELNAITIGNPQANYRDNYRGAANHQILGDVSTTYSMLPDFPGVPAKAKSLVGSDLKIIYLVRNPVSRTLSHHQHMMNDVTEEKMGPDVNVEIRNHASMIAYSRYAFQLEPWINEFGKSQIKVIKFEEYVKNRAKVTSDIFDFLEVPPFQIAVQEKGANRGHDRQVAGKFIYRFYHTRLFQKILKPFSPRFLRTAMRKILLRKSEVRSIAPTPETIDNIIESIQDDSARLHLLLGWDKPAWDFDAVRSKYA